MLTVLLPLAVVALAVWAVLLGRLAPQAAEVVRCSEYRRGDAVAACGVAGLFVWMIAASGGGGEGELSPGTILTGSAFYATLVALLYGFLVVRGHDPVRLFGLSTPRLGRRILFGMGALLAALPVVQLANFISRDFLFPGEGAQAVVDYLMENPTLEVRLPVILLAVAVAPVAEEFIFRGYLYGVARRFGGRIAAVLVTSALFAAIHLSAVALPGLLVLAICLALAYELTGSLWVPVAMHAAFNGLTVALIMLVPDIAKWS